MDQKSAIKVSTAFYMSLHKGLDKCMRLILLIMFHEVFEHAISWTIKTGKRFIYIEDLDIHSTITHK